MARKHFCFYFERISRIKSSYQKKGEIKNKDKTKHCYINNIPTSIEEELRSYTRGTGFRVNHNLICLVAEIKIKKKKNRDRNNFSLHCKKEGKRKVQGVPQSQTAALPRPQEEEETDKSKQAQTEKTYEKH